jgi:hypothetical protein
MPENHAHPVSDLSIWGGHYCEQALSLSAPLSAKDLDRALWPFLTLPRFFSVILPLATNGWFDIMRQSLLERHGRLLVSGYGRTDGEQPGRAWLGQKQISSPLRATFSRSVVSAGPPINFRRRANFPLHQ